MEAGAVERPQESERLKTAEMAQFQNGQIRRSLSGQDADQLRTQAWGRPCQSVAWPNQILSQRPTNVHRHSLSRRYQAIHQSVDLAT
jgi:hypothetical protein